MAMGGWRPLDKAKRSLDELERILQGRRSKDIPDVMAEKAFALMESGFTTRKFKEAKCCIDNALRIRQEAVFFKFIKAKCMQKLLICTTKVVNPQDSKTVEVDQIWEDLMMETYESPDLQAQVSVRYALFLNKVHQDFGKRGQRYAEKAKQLCGSNPSVLRKVATFYIRSAGNNTFKMDKAEEILQKLLKKNPNSYRVLSLYGQLFFKRYRCAPSSSSQKFYFDQAVENLKKAWFYNKKYIMPALDLVRLYEDRLSSDKTTNSIDEELLLKLESLFSELMFSCIECEDTLKADLYSAYARFLKKHVLQVVDMIKNERFKWFEKEFRDSSTTDPTNASQEKSITQIQELRRMIQQYELEGKDIQLLHQVDMRLRSVRNTLEGQENDSQVTYRSAYANFMEKYSKDLAMYYFKTSLEIKPRQNPNSSYDHLEELAKEMADSNQEHEKSKGEEMLQWINNLKVQNQI